MRRKDDVQVRAVRDFEVLQPEQVGAIRAAEDGRGTAPLVEGVLVLELSDL